MSFAAIILCVASQRVFIVVYFVIDSVRKLLDTPSCKLRLKPVKIIHLQTDFLELVKKFSVVMELKYSSFIIQHLTRHINLLSSGYRGLFPLG
jgi:hypothetical protein